MKGLGSIFGIIFLCASFQAEAGLRKCRDYLRRTGAWERTEFERPFRLRPSLSYRELNAILSHYNLIVNQQIHGLYQIDVDRSRTHGLSGHAVEAVLEIEKHDEYPGNYGLYATEFNEGLVFVVVHRQTGEVVQSLLGMGFDEQSEGAARYAKSLIGTYFLSSQIFRLE